MIILFVCNSCNQGIPVVGVNKDAQHWPFPFFGEFISFEGGYDFLYFNRAQRRLSLYDDKNIKKLDYAHTYYSNGDYHQQSFVWHNRDSLFMLDKNLSDIILFDSEGIIKRHFWFKNRALNHLSSYKNQPIYINGSMYLTTLLNCENNRPYELAINLINGTSHEIEIPFPPDLVFNQNINQAFLTPAKHQVNNTLVYHFPTSNYLVFFRPHNNFISFKQIDWEGPPLRAPKPLTSKDYKSSLEDYNQSEKIVQFSYNKNSKEFLFVKQHFNNNWIEVTDSKLKSKMSFQLGVNCYYESILPLEDYFVALGYHEKSQDPSLSYFKKIQDLNAKL